MVVARDLCAAGLVSALLSTSAPSGAVSPDEALRHLRAAQRQAAGHPAVERGRRAWCDASAGPADAALATQAVHRAEEAYRAAADAAQAPSRERLRALVVRRECAAFVAVRLQPQLRLPVWLLSELSIVSVRVSPGQAEAVRAEATARNVEGPVVNSRITFAQGLHMACFGLTDARGAVRCTLVDTHPHDPGSRHEGDEHDEAAHGGALVASLAGSASADRVELPAVVQRDMPRRRTARVRGDAVK